MLGPIRLLLSVLPLYLFVLFFLFLSTFWLPPGVPSTIPLMALFIELLTPSLSLPPPLLPHQLLIARVRDGDGDGGKIGRGVKEREEGNKRNKEGGRGEEVKSEEERISRKRRGSKEIDKWSEEG